MNRFSITMIGLILLFMFHATGVSAEQIASEEKQKLGQKMIEALALNRPMEARYLLTQGVDPNEDIDGITVLMAACMHGGHLDIVQDLVSNGADINSQNKNGLTALYNAASGGSLDIVEFLLDHGANPNAGHNLDGTPIMAASSKGRSAVVRALLRHAADVNGQDRYGTTALEHAALNGDVSLVRILLDAGADPTLTSTSGRYQARPSVWVESKYYLLKKAVASPPSIRETSPDLKAAIKWGIAVEDLQEIIRMLKEAEAKWQPSD